LSLRYSCASGKRWREKDPIRTFNLDSFVSVALETYRVMMLILRGWPISATKGKAADFIQANVVNSADES